MSDPESSLLFSQHGAIATLTINRPEARNALSPEMQTRLMDVTAQCERDASVRCVVIRAVGDHFMAGGDVKSFHKALTTDRAAHVNGFEPRVVRAHQTIYHLRRMQKPVLVSAQGGVAGFGFSLLMAADLAIVAEDAFLTLAYRHIGLTADGGATYFLPRIVGERRALEIALLGERFSAAVAKEWGLVNWVVPRAALAAETDRIAQALATGPTRALGMTKTLLRNALDASWDEQSHREAEAIAAAVATDDHLEGATAFVEKRKPVFTGR